MEDFYKVVPCYLLSFSHNGHLTDINELLLKDLGYGSGEVLLHKKFDSLLTLGSKIFFQTHFYPLIKLHGVYEEIYLTLQSKSGEEIPVLLNARMEKQEEGYAIHCIAMRISQRAKFERELREAKKTAEDALIRNDELVLVRDSLEKHQLDLDQKQILLEQRNRELSELNIIISHDLQEPLRKISVLIDRYLIDRKGGMSESDTAYLNRVMGISMQARNMLVGLQTYGSIVQLNSPQGIVTISDVIEQWQQQHDVEITQRNGQIRVRNGNVRIEGYPDFLILLLQNLLDNALKFYDPHKKELLIDVTCTEIEDNQYKKNKEKYKYINYVKITIGDNGIGFDQQYAEQMFSLLRRGGAGQTYEGQGIGLALAKRIVELHHGTITALSTPGNGSSFSIILPSQIQVPA